MNYKMFRDFIFTIEKREARIAELEAALATARREGMEEAAQIADSCAADWTKSAKGKYLETKWDYESRANAGEEIAAAIRAALEGGEVMSDDLVKRLQHLGDWQAADRIEALQARIAELEAALKKIVRKTRHAHPLSYVSDYYRIAHAALEGGKKDE